MFMAHSVHVKAVIKAALLVCRTLTVKFDEH